MKVKRKRLFLFLSLLAAETSACALAHAGQGVWALLSSLTGYVFAFWLVRSSVKGLNTLSVFFLLFFFLYCYTAPITAIIGVAPGDYLAPATYSLTTEFIFQVSLALTAFCLPYLWVANKRYFQPPEKPAWHTRLWGLAIGSAVLASLSELINFVRVGGISTLIQGKAIYQEATQDLFITLPSLFLAYLAFATFGLALSWDYKLPEWKWQKEKKALYFIIAILPVVIIFMMLGRRGPLVGWGMCFIIGLTYFTYIKKLRPRPVAIIIAAYLLLAMVFIFRGKVSQVLQSGHYSELVTAFGDTKRYQKLNPAYNEFGAAFLNFINFRQREKSTDIPRLNGSSYAEALITPVPRFLLPFEKPTAITYRFRDMFFEMKETRSRISSTGFSSILEAYWNFGAWGVAPIYLVVGMLLFFFERARAKGTRGPLLYAGVYILLAPITQLFHRSAFGSAFSTALVLIVLYVVLVMIILGPGRLFRSITSSKATSA